MSQVITANVSEREYDMIMSVLRKSEMSMSGYIKYCILFERLMSADSQAVGLLSDHAKKIFFEKFYHFVPKGGE
ncbi:MAG: hypothetical protein A3I04_01280 [Nitrospinae bacterium RIFCSPLOWO2_02_FULL_39_110]|nr:MAG: hypothetical protein A3D20_03570 [Nitrospinae bacterium RIFCSPHIGHO2_02_FULL_39_82]OGW03997.1 MAG: hypothetical protein A3I04_01280 [Nitrospinae bacterium RIFCSPLOWO2_02_FULL_39_110]